LLEKYFGRENKLEKNSRRAQKETGKVKMKLLRNIPFSFLKDGIGISNLLWRRSLIVGFPMSLAFAGAFT